jgi:nucleotide-binding universal stress UspA family protein
MEAIMYSSILVGTDGSAAARGAVSRAAQLAQLCGAKLLVVSAFRPSKPSMMSAVAPVAEPDREVEVRAEVEAMLAKLASELRSNGLEVETIAYAGNAAQAILDIAETHDVDLIVVGNKGMGGARKYLGSIPNNVAHGASCGVMIVRTGGD